jgi:hypothetical protein
MRRAAGGFLIGFSARLARLLGYRGGRMSRHAFDDPMAGVQVVQRSGGGWRQLLWLALTSASLGFAGYVYVVPYHQAAGALDARTRELQMERSGNQEIAADRDRVKATAAKLEATEKERAARETKRKGDVDELAGQLRPALEPLGVGVTTQDGRVMVSLPGDKAIDKNGIDISGDGNAVLKVLAGAVKKEGGTLRIKARFGAAPAPKQLRALFGTVGEVSAVRAARAMSALEGAGVAPDHLSIVGEPEAAAAKGAGKAGSKAKKAAAAAAAERLDIEIEP